jgi:hypothetical protein
VKKAFPQIPFINIGIGVPNWAADAYVITIPYAEAGLPKNRMGAANQVSSL